MKRKHVNRMISVAAMAVLLVGGSLAISADPPAASPPAPGADVFKDKGLVIAENRLVLPVEAELKEQVRQLRIAKAKATTEANNRKSVDAAVVSDKEKIKELNTEYARANDLLSTTADPAKQNQIIGRANAITTATKQLQADLDSQIEKQKELTVAKEAYIELVADVSKNIDTDEHAYDDISKDTDVASALGEYNATAKLKLKLGPTSEFTDNLKFVKRTLADVSIEVVQVSTEHGVPEVEVVLNGKTKQMMVWDSGATSVVISTELAASLGMHPGPRDPVIKAKLADGHIVSGHQMTLKSVSVGVFTVNDVECDVMDPDVKDEALLLGDTFQSHFLSKLDQGGGTLRLTPVDNNSIGKHAGIKNNAGAKPAP
jgi:clan AA aspartic protease (TIGR02281 family)